GRPAVPVDQRHQRQRGGGGEGGRRHRCVNLGAYRGGTEPAGVAVRRRDRRGRRIGVHRPGGAPGADPRAVCRGRPAPGPPGGPAVSGLVVVGDVLLDTDIDGTVARTSPEAPVPVLEISRRRRRPGGAGLAALLAAAGTRPVTLIAALGTDPDSRRIIELFADRCRALPPQPPGTPAGKPRVRGPKGQLLRIDHGTGRAGDGPVSADIERAVAGADAILVADYGRGVAAHPRLRSLLTAAARQVPVVWDPHPRGPAPVPGVRAV